MTISMRSITTWAVALCAALWASPAAGQIAGLAMPGSFEITNMGDGVRAYLHWTDTSATETHFEIVREKAVGIQWSEQAVLVAPKDTTNKMDSPGSGLFRYRMRAVNAAGGSYYTSWTFGQIEMVPPTAPWNLAFTDMGDGERARLSWTDRSNNESGFELVRQKQSSTGVWFGDTVLNAPANAETLVNRPGIGSYRYRIRSVNAAGPSAWSGWVYGAVAPLGSSGGNTVAPLAPSNLEAVNLGDGVRAYVRWDDNSDNEDGFRLFRDQLVAGAWAQDGQIELEPNSTNMTDSPGPGTYRYTIRAFNDVGASPFSNPAVITVALVTPTVPTDLEFTDLGDGLRAKLTWIDRSNNEDGFEILRQKQNTSGAWFGDTTLLGSANSETINNAPGPGSYRFRIRSTNAAGGSSWSAWVNGVIADVLPAAPSDLTAADLGNQSQVQLTWTDNSTNESGFQLERETQSGAAWGSAATIAAGANIELLTDAPGLGTHRYRIRSVNGVGPSAFTAWTVVSVGGQPSAAPTNAGVVSLQNGSQARVTWTDNSGDETGFEIERQTEQTFSWGPTVTLTAGANSQAYTDTPGLGTHRYRIRAVGPGGASAFTAWVEVQIVSPLPAAPTGLAVVSMNDGLRARLTWLDNSNNESGFEVERQTQSGTTWGATTPLAAAANTTVLVDTAGVGTHRYRVRAVNAAGASGFTAWATVVIISVAPAPPSGLTVVSLNDGLRARLDWSDNSLDETGFQVERQTAGGTTWGPSTMISTPANTVTYTDVPGPGSHRYRVRAVSGGGQSAFTPWVQVTVTGAAPSAPTGLQAVDAGNRRALLSWTDTSTNESRFDIERQPAFSGGTVSVSPNVTGYIDNCGAGTFQYRVRAANSVGVSAWTGWVSVVVADVPPAAPSGLTVADLGNQSSVKINWIDNSDNETGFSIERQTNTGGSTWGQATTLTAPANATTKSDTPGPGTHRYRIAAVNAVGSSPFSNWVNVTVMTGWTQLTPSADSRIIYVSSSTGNDSNTGLSEGAPKKTIAAGKALLRNNFPDWLLLKRGDVWDESIDLALSGRSVTEMLVVGSYGTQSARPLMRTGNTNGFTRMGGGRNDYVAVMGLAFWAHNRTPEDNPTGFIWLDAGSNILVEDCLFREYSNNMTVQGGPNTIDNVRVRRSVFVDAYCSSGHSQGLFASYVNGLLVEECVFDHNGWKEGAAVPTMFNHNIYVQATSGPAVVRNNIIANGASHGAQLRPGGILSGNLLVRNALGGFIAGPAAGSQITNNVVLHGRDIDPSTPRGSGLEILDTAGAGAVMANNLVAHRDATGYNGTALTINGHTSAVTGNTVYDWSTPDGPAVLFGLGSVGTYSNTSFTGNTIAAPGYSVVVSGVQWQPGCIQLSQNRYWSSMPAQQWFRLSGSVLTYPTWVTATGETGSAATLPQLPDPSRSVAGYDAIIGGSGSIDSFLAKARQQSRFSWDSRYSAQEANAWIRAGYAMP